MLEGPRNGRSETVTPALFRCSSGGRFCGHARTLANTSWPSAAKRVAADAQSASEPPHGSLSIVLTTAIRMSSAANQMKPPRNDASHSTQRARLPVAAANVAATERRVLARERELTRDVNLRTIALKRQFE